MGSLPPSLLVSCSLVIHSVEGFTIALPIQSLDPTRVGRTVFHRKRDRDGS